MTPDKELTLRVIKKAIASGAVAWVQDPEWGRCLQGRLERFREAGSKVEFLRERAETGSHAAALSALVEWMGWEQRKERIDFYTVRIPADVLADLDKDTDASST